MSEQPTKYNQNSQPQSPANIPVRRAYALNQPRAKRASTRKTVVGQFGISA
jgi:hypothetical protein